LWPIFIEQFEKNWPDFPSEKYFVTNHKSIPESSFQELKIGDDRSWSHGLGKALNILKHKFSYVLITLEDLPIVEKVDSGKFSAITEEFFRIRGNFLKFINKPKATKKFNSDFGLIETGSFYRSTCVYSLWKIETLLKLLKEEENAWQFERFGSIRSDNYDKFFVVYEDFFKIINLVVKGKWVPSELDKMKRKMLIPPSFRPKFSKTQNFKYKFNAVLFYLFSSCCPWKLQRKIAFAIKKYKQ
jgi:hypothetical protein